MPPFPGPPVLAPSANGLPVSTVNGTPLGFQTEDTAAAVGLTVPQGTVYALVSPTGGAVMWRDDGVAPTSEVGMPLAANQTLTVSGPQLHTIKFIQQVTDASINVSYYA